MTKALTWRDRIGIFIDSEITTLLWCTNGVDGETPLDKDYNIDDVDDSVYNEMWDEAKQFLTGNREIKDLMSVLQPAMLEQAGHDFALTRNGHGAGFWDGDWDRPNFRKDWGQVLTDWSKTFGEIELYNGDDDQIHMRKSR